MGNCTECRAHTTGVRLPPGGGKGTPERQPRPARTNRRSFTAGGRKRNAGWIGRVAVEGLLPVAGGRGFLSHPAGRVVSSWYTDPRRMRTMTLKAGDPAPDFALPDLRGRKVIVYFYPRADTPGCTTQACSLRDAREPLEVAGATVIGISPD